MAWIQEAQQNLLGLRCAAGGWGYRPQTPAVVEPTVLACLGLLASASGGEHSSNPFADVAHASGDWLAAGQQPDGGLGIADSLRTPQWMTPYAILLWSAMIE